jgi:4-carboxymuconolactone decarboxylase
MAADEGRWGRGVEMTRRVYAGDVVTAPKGALAFSDLMLEQLFAEVWTRQALSIKERRLVIMDVIACMGGKDTWKIQAKAALENGEVDAEQLRELVITLDAGHSRAAGILGPTEAAIAELAKEQAEGGGSERPAQGICSSSITLRPRAGGVST